MTTVAPITEAEFLACEMAVLRALEVAGKRCRNVSRDRRRLLIAETPDHLLYTRLSATEEDCERLLDGAWGHLRMVLPGRPDLYEVCDQYVRRLLLTRAAHTRDHLLTALAGRRG